MSAPTVTLDHAGIGALLRSDEFRAIVEAHATAGRLFAEAISPDAPPYGEGYMSSFEVSSGLADVTERGGPRIVAYLSNTSEYAMAVEEGWDLAHDQWTDRPGYHVLKQTADMLENP